MRRANVQGRGIRMKGETAYIVSLVSLGSALFLTIRPIGLANRCVVLTDTDLLCGVSGRHGPIEGLPWPSSGRPQI